MQSCQKSSTGTFTPNTDQTDTVWAPDDSVPPVTASIDKPAIVDSFNSNNDDNSITSGDSVTINFPVGGCLTQPNTPSSAIKTSAKIQIAITLLTSKGDLIRHAMPSVSNTDPLAFGACVDMQLSYKKSPIYWNSALAPIQIKVHDNMALNGMLYAVYQQNPTVLPIINPTAIDSSWFVPQVSPSMSNSITVYTTTSNKKTIIGGYQIRTTKIGWIGCVFPFDTSSHFLPKTRLNAILPLSYTNKNTVVYAVFNDFKTVVRLSANPQGKSYGTTNIPVGYNITLVSISNLHGTYYLGTKVIEHVADSSPVSITPVQKDISDIDRYLKTL